MLLLLIASLSLGSAYAEDISRRLSVQSGKENAQAESHLKGHIRALSTSSTPLFEGEDDNNIMEVEPYIEDLSQFFSQAIDDAGGHLSCTCGHPVVDELLELLVRKVVDLHASGGSTHSQG